MKRFEKQKLINGKVSKDLKRNGPEPSRLYPKLKINQEGNPRCPYAISVNC